VTYIAQFNEITRQYTITFEDEDGTELQSGLVPYGTSPVYNVTQEHPLPTKAADNQYTYTFAGWYDGTTEYSKDVTLPTVT
jgi:hypothetical protein